MKRKSYLKMNAKLWLWPLSVVIRSFRSFVFKTFFLVRVLYVSAIPALACVGEGITPFTPPLYTPHIISDAVTNGNGTRTAKWTGNAQWPLLAEPTVFLAGTIVFSLLLFPSLYCSLSASLFLWLSLSLSLSFSLLLFLYFYLIDRILCRNTQLFHCT